MSEQNKKIIRRTKNPFDSPTCPETPHQQASAFSDHIHVLISQEHSHDMQPTIPTCPGQLPARIKSAGSIQRHDTNNTDDHILATPCKQVAQLNIHDKQKSPKDKPKKKLKGKLLGSKSLSQLMSKINRGSTEDNEQKSDQRFQKSHSGFLPKQSTSNLSGNQVISMASSTMKSDLEISPIFGTQGKLMRQIVASTPSLPLNRDRESAVDCRLRANNYGDTGKTNGSTKTNKTHQDQKGIKIKPFKNTKLVLRDVKNSIRLRLKAKRENQEFEKLTNESMSTPDIKLYSPFNIYTPSENKAVSLARKSDPKRSKKRLNLANENSPAVSIQGSEKSNVVKDTKGTSPKSRKSLKSKIALRHQMHLMETNSLAFDSPTGRLRATVKDVEQLQRCIENISEEIKARGELLS